MIKNNIQTSLIFEDDVLFTDIENINNDVNDITSNLPLDWEIIFLGHSTFYGHPIIEKTTPYVGKTNRNHCTHAYLISLEGAKNIFQHLLTKGMYRAIDMFYVDYLKSKNIFYTSIKSLAIQNPIFNSNIQKENRIYGFKI
jgi:GR25 family glycosyltransferase involved in LPS biosynthesis